MNKQGKLIDGRVIGGIEWVKSIREDGTERQGYTWNPVGGCKHACRWRMPDGTIAECYAETTANRVANAAYPNGFEHHYWHADRLHEPVRVKEPSGIFLDSMSDLMGVQVPADQIRAVLDVCARAHWHHFILLTKNAPRLLKFEFPANVWVLVSSPPDFMFGRELPHHTKYVWLMQALEVLRELKVHGKAKTVGMSFEPLSKDWSTLVSNFSGVLDWAIIGAASRGKEYFQPNPSHVFNLLRVLDEYNVAVFFKGNLRGNPAAVPWREEFPR